MSAQQTPAFRSRAQREQEVQLVRNYREIGIAAIAAAASHVGRAKKAANDDAATAALAAAE